MIRNPRHPEYVAVHANRMARYMKTNDPESYTGVCQECPERNSPTGSGPCAGSCASWAVWVTEATAVAITLEGNES